MWAPRYFTTSYWTPRYWPPGGVPTTPPIHPHALVAVGTSGLFHVEWAQDLDRTLVTTAPAPVVRSRPSTVRLGETGFATTRTRKKALVSQATRSTVSLELQGSGGGTTTTQSPGELDTEHQASAPEVSDD